jgi:LuxR family maltose regulon positive regulatory protein
MPEPLLTTKFYIPEPRPNLVPRPRLVERLDEGLRLGRKLTIVSAPAGFGKTTLLSEWLSYPGTARQGYSPGCESAQRVSWLSLDEGDNDPIRFLTYLIAALQQAHEGIGQDVLGSLYALQPLSLPVQELLAACINQIDAVESQIVLVLDDYHLITSPKIHKTLTYLLDHLPRNLHLVIATRADPPLHIARLRGRGQLTELRQADLSFSVREVDSYLRQVMGLDLSPDDVAALAARTEGWITGLQMAALAVQRKDAARVSAFLATFTGRHEHIVDYFADEVLGWQPGNVKAFLLQTSILERLSGPLCDAVCGARSEDAGRQSGQQILERLQEANLFVVPLDDERQWYRYHRLFADLLRQRLRQVEPDSVPILHRRASQWYGQNGFVEEAIDHALVGKDLQQAALLIEKAAEPILMRGELVTLTAWLGALPGEIVRQRPLLCFYYAAVLLLNGEPPTKIQTYLQIAVAHGIPDSTTLGAMVLRALLALWQGDVDRSMELGQQALASLPEQNLLWRGIVTGNLGIAYLYNGRDLDLADRMLEEAARMGERAGNVMGAVIALCNLAELRIVQGQLWAAKRLYDRALALAVDDRGHSLPISGMAVAGLAALLQEWNELEEAERLLTRAVDLASENLPIGVLVFDGYLTLARVKQSQGDLKAAQDAIERARTVAASTGATELDDWFVGATQARLWIAQGHLDAAARWARSRGLVDRPVTDPSDAGRSSLPYSLYELEHLTLAELWIAQDNTRRALDELAALLAKSSALQRTDSVIKILVLMALAHHQQKHLDRALEALAQALAQAESGGYVRTFVDRGPRMTRLLRQALAQGVAVEYVQRLLMACDAGAVPPLKNQMLVEPLSDRELQVLRLLTTYLASAEIGQELCISVNTVRFHTKNIYSKLGVHTRRDAVQRAKELGLL